MPYWNRSLLRNTSLVTEWWNFLTSINDWCTGPFFLYLFYKYLTNAKCMISNWFWLGLLRLNSPQCFHLHVELIEFTNSYTTNKCTVLLLCNTVPYLTLKTILCAVQIRTLPTNAQFYYYAIQFHISHWKPFYVLYKSVHYQQMHSSTIMHFTRN